MAMLMGSSKAKSSLYEKGLRSLNTNELSILSALELVLNDASAMQATETIDSNDQKALLATLKKLANNQKEVALKVARMQEKLFKMKTDYASNLKLLQVLNRLKNNQTDLSAHPYLGLLEIRCLEKLKANGVHQQILLRHRLAVLESEMTSAQQIIEEYQGFDKE